MGFKSKSTKQNKANKETREPIKRSMVGFSHAGMRTDKKPTPNHRNQKKNPVRTIMNDLLDDDIRDVDVKIVNKRNNTSVVSFSEIMNNDDNEFKKKFGVAKPKISSKKLISAWIKMMDKY
tara:strand:+ start:70 stop:432 length:363 start_codon:yes stop_codon:yes gene_type:complete